MSFEPSASVAVLMILGSGRSGSTVLGNLLGAAEGHFSAGEVRYLWERGLVEGRRCGCGAPVAECPVWGPSLRRAFPHGLDAMALASSLRSAVRLRELPALLAPRARQRSRNRHGPLLDALGALYRAVAAESGAEVIVDSSKLPSYALLLDAVPGVHVTFLHLVRDPRAAAWSWQRVKALPDAEPGRHMQRQSASKSAILWDVANAVGVAMGRRAPGRYLRIRYEDFVASPRAVADRALALGGHGGSTLPFLDETTVHLATGHAVAGNPNRMTGGDVRLRSDDEWRSRLPARDRAMATVLSAPLLPLCGYGVRSRSAP